MSSLTDRYLAATLRSVPAPRREEIATELRASIEDMIEDRTGGGQDAPTAEREVLTELGNPEQLAARYADRRLQLIGPAYYLVWQRLLRLLLTFVPAIVGAVVAAIEVADGNGAGAIGSGIAAALEAAIQIAFWVTLAFAVIERTNARLDLPEWSVDRLPDTPADRDVPLTDTIAAVVFLVLAIAWLPWQHVHSWVEDGNGENIPLIDPALWTPWLPVLIAVLLASVVFEIVKYRIGHWTWPLVAVKVVLNLAFAVPVVWLMLSDRLLNPDLVQRFAWLQDDANLDTITGIIVVTAVVITVWDLIDSFVKTRRRVA